MLRLLERNGFVTNAAGDYFISELQSERKYAALWIKIRFTKIRFKYHQKKSRKHMMEDEKQGLMHMKSMSVNQAVLHSLSSQGKNTVTLVITINRQRSHLKYLAKNTSRSLKRKLKLFEVSEFIASISHRLDF